MDNKKLCRLIAKRLIEKQLIEIPLFKTVERIHEVENVIYDVLIEEHH